MKEFISPDSIDAHRTGREFVKLNTELLVK